MAVLGVGGPTEQGIREQPPVNKFNVFIDNYLEQANKGTTEVAGETAGIALDKARDNTPLLDETTKQDWTSRVPNLKIPDGTRQATGKALLNNQMKKNLNTAIVQDPQNNGTVAWAGAILGGTQRFILDPTVVAALGVGSFVKEGAGLLASRYLPELPSLAKFFPEAAQKIVLAGIEGGTFGFSDALFRESAEAAQRKVLRGEDTPVKQFVQGAIDEAGLTALGGIGLDVAGRGIAKGFKLLEARKFNENPVMDEELSRREEVENKAQFQSNAQKIGDNHVKAATENVSQASQSVEKAAKESKEAIITFKKLRPEHEEINQLSETLDTINKSDAPLNEKVQGLAMIRRELSGLSKTNDNILDEHVTTIDKNINSYVRNLSDSKLNEDVGSLSRILSDYRVITPNDVTNLKKVAIAQMQEGRAANVEPYINELVVQNSQNLIERLAESGINRGRVLHATLDSLDVIKNRESKLEDSLKNIEDLLKEAKEKPERQQLRGQRDGITALKSIVTGQRATHELIATALTNGFKPSTGEQITSFLANQTSVDSEIMGGYGKLIEDLGGEPVEDILARVEEKPESFTPESKAEQKILTDKKNLAKPIIEDAFKCLIGE